MAWQGYDNEGCMPGDRERFARRHDRRLENDCKRRTATAKRDLTTKILAAIDNVEAGHFTRINVRAAVERVFVEQGVELASTQKGEKV